MRGHWSSAASMVLAVFVVVGLLLLAAGRTPGGITCLVLAAAYVPVRTMRGRLMAASRRLRSR